MRSTKRAPRGALVILAAGRELGDCRLRRLEQFEQDHDEQERRLDVNDQERERKPHGVHHLPQAARRDRARRAPGRLRLPQERHVDHRRSAGRRHDDDRRLRRRRRLRRGRRSAASGAAAALPAATPSSPRRSRRAARSSAARASARAGFGAGRHAGGRHFSAAVLDDSTEVIRLLHPQERLSRRCRSRIRPRERSSSSRRASRRTPSSRLRTRSARASCGRHSVGRRRGTGTTTTSTTTSNA